MKNYLKELKVYVNDTNFNKDLFTEYLCIFRDTNSKPHFVHIFSVGFLFELDFIYDSSRDDCDMGDDALHNTFDFNYLSMRGPINFVYAKNE